MLSGDLLEPIRDWKRTSYCGEVTFNDIGREVILFGWVHSRRDHGGLIFIDLRDREGIVQLIFNPEIDKDLHTKAHELKSEFVIAVKGIVNRRPEGTENPDLKTGSIEIIVNAMKILNTSISPPFPINEEVDVAEHLRLKYRYLDLRKNKIQNNLIFRHRLTKAVRTYLDRNGFLEIETPFLTKSTPEGARDYLVPSRVNPGCFYALPQSPQLFKQILMVSGFDRYFQIVRCFRDEDLRADRQPEFTQIDIEMAFVNIDDVLAMMEGMISYIFKETLGIKIEIPFLRIPYHKAIEKYGTDKPDTRFGLEFIDITGIVSNGNFKVFSEAIKKGGIVKGMNAKGGGSFSRKDLDEITEFVKNNGGHGVAWAKVEGNTWHSPISKFFTDVEKKSISDLFYAVDGDLLLLLADMPEVVNECLSKTRKKIAEMLGLIKRDEYSFIWVTDFPLLQYDENEKRFVAMHHPFTAPLDEDIELLKKSPELVRAKAYDLVLNGVEIGGGSIRIHRRDIQKQIFKVLGIGDEEANKKFGFLLDALDFGAPPHGGIAFGFDRIVMLMCKEESIREVIAFPKTQKATCLMTDAPSEVEKKQLDELHIKLNILKQK